MITIEQLNAIPGRPPTIEWLTNNNGATFVFRHHGGDSFARIKGDALELFNVTAPVSPTELLTFALYIRRVEIEIERLKHEDMFLKGSSVCDRHDAIDYAVGRVDDDEDVIEVNIVPTSRVYPGECVDLDTLGEHIIDQCEEYENGQRPGIRWKDGANEALSVFLDTYADLAPWYVGEAEESVTVRLIRTDGHVVDWGGS